MTVHSTHGAPVAAAMAPTLHVWLHLLRAALITRVPAIQVSGWSHADDDDDELNCIALWHTQEQYILKNSSFVSCHAICLTVLFTSRIVVTWRFLITIPSPYSFVTRL